MPDCVTDTHALVWYLTADKRLSPAARAVFEDADNGRIISATAISLGLPLISKDAAITALSELSIVW